MKKFVLLIQVIYFCFAVSQPQPLKLSDCIHQATEKNPSLEISRAKVRAAEARYSEVNASLLPQIKFLGRVTELSSVPEFSLTLPPPINKRTLFPSITESYAMRFTLQQPLFMGLKLIKNKEMADFNADASKEDYSRERSELILNIISTYWNLYSAKRIEEALKQSVEQMNEHLKDVKSLFQQGMATDAEVMKVQVQLSDVKVRHIESKNSIRIASMLLNSLIGQPLETEIEPIETPELQNESIHKYDLEDLKNIARERRPDIKAMRFRCDMNYAGVTAAKSGWYPQIFLAANYDYANPNQRIFPQEAKWNSSWDIGLTVQWNVWDWFATEHQTTQAEAVLRQSEAGLAQINDAISLDVARHYYSAQTSSEKVQVAKIGVEVAEESFRLAYQKFKNGLLSNSDLLDAEVALLQAKLTYTQAVIEFIISIAQLKKAVGEL